MNQNDNITNKDIRSFIKGLTYILVLLPWVLTGVYEYFALSSLGSDFISGALVIFIPVGIASTINSYIVTPLLDKYSVLMVPNEEEDTNA